MSIFEHRLLQRRECGRVNAHRTICTVEIIFATPMRCQLAILCKRREVLDDKDLLIDDAGRRIVDIEFRKRRIVVKDGADRRNVEHRRHRIRSGSADEAKRIHVRVSCDCNHNMRRRR